MIYSNKVRKGGKSKGYNSYAGGEQIVKSVPLKSNQPFSLYAQTLLDPFNYRGCRIPDLACYPTGVFTQEEEFTWTVSTAPYDPVTPANNTNNRVLIVRIAAENGSNYNFAGVEVTPPTTGGVTYTTGTTPQLVGTNPASRYSSQRVVSGGIQVKFAGNDATSQGVIRGCVLTKNDIIQVNSGHFEQFRMASSVTSPNPGAVTQFNDIANVSNNPVAFGTLAILNDYINDQRVSYQGPMKYGIGMRYKPVDPLSFTMKTTEVQTLWTGNVSQYDEDAFFVISLDGVANGTVLTCRIVVNYEGVVRSDTTGILSLSSPASAASTDHGLNMANSIAGIDSAGSFASTAASTARLVGRLP